jgi:hypothetical protein
MLYIGVSFNNMLSKLLYPYSEELENKFIKKCYKETSILETGFNYQTYKKDKNLKQFKLNKLKDIAKYNKIPVTATKKVLIDRIESHFQRSILCEKIQKVFRGSLVRRSFLLRGPALKDRSVCVNDTDFITLEPLNEIDAIHFFSYTIDQHIYGCNIYSLAEYIKKNGVKHQPYNRSPFPDDVLSDFFTLWSILKIIQKFPEDVIKNNSVSFLQNNIREPENELIEQLRNIRNKSIETRIQEVFMEIDQLGNYTNSRWFSSLSEEQYCLFYRQLFNIWSRLTRDMRSRIYMIGNPFAGNNRNENDMRNNEFIREACLFVLENFVYGGSDIEYRKIGTLHALTALTVASIHARNSMYWLYESLLG